MNKNGRPEQFVITEFDCMFKRFVTLLEICLEINNTLSYVKNLFRIYSGFALSFLY